MNQMGVEGFKWFFGIVEDVNDPEKLGRLRIRIHDIHSTNKVKLPVDKLIWATPINSIFSAGVGQVGLTPLGAVVGTTAFGFFADNEKAQIPILLGTLAGMPGMNQQNNDLPEESRGINNLNKQLVGPEPSSAFNAKYPYNKVFKSESGHVFEVDDTPNFERLHTYHKSGTYTEVDSTGRRVNKIVGDDYEIVVRDKTVFVQGNVNIQINGAASVTCSQTTWNGNITLNGDLTATGTITGQQNVTGGGVSVNSHTHPDPQGGSTGTPQ